MKGKLAYILFISLLVTSCAENDCPSIGTDKEVRIQAAVKETAVVTKADPVAANNGDYYLYYSPADPSDKQYDGLMNHTYACEDGVFTTATSLYWDDINKNKNTFYLTNMDAMTFAGSGVYGQDILFAKAEDVAWKSELTFTLSHLMSQLTVVLEDNTLNNDIEFKNTKVTFYPGLTRRARGIDYAEEKVKSESYDKETRTTVSDYTQQGGEEGDDDRQVTLDFGYVAPQTFQPKDSMEITAGKYVYRIPVPKFDNDEAITMAGGEHLTITISLTEDDVVARAKLVDWENKSGNTLEVSRVFNIGNWNELKDLMMAINTGYTFKGMVVRLTHDIELEGRISLGTEEHPFEGIFGGNGHVIRNLGLKDADDNNNMVPNQGGLFGYTRGATLQNIVLESPHVVSKENSPVGALVDIAEETTIFNCKTQSSESDGAGKVEGASNYTGGLVGKGIGNSSLTNCYSYVAVTGGEEYTGGLVGAFDGSIIFCTAHGSVTSTTGIFVGGLAGYAKADVTYSYARGEVNGHSQVGGLIGLLGGTAQYCYADGDVIKHGTEYGGFVGSLEFGVVVNNCFWKHSANYGGAGSITLNESCKAYPDKITVNDMLAILNKDNPGLWRLDSDGLPDFKHD